MHYYKKLISIKEMEIYKKNGLAIDANMGGLILGRSHDEGGIYFWIKRGENYSLEGEVEGYEYILNLGATNFFSKSTYRFHQYDKHKFDFKEYVPNSDIKILDTRNGKEPRYLLFEDCSFSIVNKYSTKAYLETIDKMNKAVYFEVIDDENLRILFNKEINEVEIKYYDSLECLIQINHNINKNFYSVILNKIKSFFKIKN